MKSKLITLVAHNLSKLYWIYSIAIFLVTTLSRLLFNGEIYDFDYHLYQPDGAAYTFMTLRFLGNDDSPAAAQVIQWYRDHGQDGLNLPFSYFSQEENPLVWALVSSRILYPILSIPSVALFGIPGMLVIPIISFGLFFFAIVWKAWKVKNLFVGSAVSILLSTSSTIPRWFLSNITDGLLASLFALLIVLNIEKIRRVFYFQVTILIIMTSLTRFCLPYWIAIAGVFLNRRKYPPGIFILLTSSLAFLPTFFIARDQTNMIVVSQSEGLWQKLLYFPISAFRILFIEVSQLAAIDRSLLILLAVALFLSVWRIKLLSSQLFLACLIAGWFIGTINGVLGVNFRFQLPVIAFAAWSVLEALRLKTVRPKSSQ